VGRVRVHPDRGGPYVVRGGHRNRDLESDMPTLNSPCASTCRGVADNHCPTFSGSGIAFGLGSDRRAERVEEMEAINA
jgi:hypothetical protein